MEQKQWWKKLHPYEQLTVSVIALLKISFLMIIVSQMTGL